MKLLKESNNTLIFTATLSESLANAIRRYIFHIPVYAIDSVEISRNDSALYDETVAHRLGLVPLIAPKSTTKEKEFKLALSTKAEGFVLSGSLKGDLAPALENIPITLLGKGQELDLVAIAKQGEGSTHAKFSPGFMSYRQVMEVKTEKDCPGEVAEICPREVFTLEGGSAKVVDAVACDFCSMCVEYGSKQGKTYVSISPSNDLHITLESFGQLPTEDLFKKSIDYLKKDLTAVSKEISKSK